MAATFVVEDGTGKADANSYLSETDADQYFDNYGAPSDWTGADSAAKQAALRDGTQYIDAQYGTRWKGTRTNETQRLDWPRADVVDSDDFVIDSDDLPQALKDATAEAALRSITETDGLMPDLDNPGQVKRLMQKLGPLEQETEYTGGNSPIKRFRILDRLLASLITGSEVRRT